MFCLNKVWCTDLFACMCMQQCELPRLNFVVWCDLGQALAKLRQRSQVPVPCPQWEENGTKAPDHVRAEDSYTLACSKSCNVVTVYSLRLSKYQLYMQACKSVYQTLCKWTCKGFFSLYCDNNVYILKIHSCTFQMFSLIK